jgi:hypothetical protein
MLEEHRRRVLGRMTDRPRRRETAFGHFGTYRAITVKNN